MRCIEGLKAKGWNEGRNLKVEIRWAGDDDRRIRDYAADLAELDARTPDRHRSRYGEGAAVGGRRTCRWCFVNVVDPVGAGLVAALERPGGGVTGFCQTEFGASTQWPEILKRIAPNLMRVAIIHDPDIRPNRDQIAAIQTVAPAIGIEAFGVDAKKLPRAGARRRGIFPHAQWRSDRRHGRAVVAASAAPSSSLRRASSCRRSMPTGCS